MFQEENEEWGGQELRMKADRLTNRRLGSWMVVEFDVCYWKGRGM